MENENSRTRVIKAELADGTTIDIQSSVSGEEDVALTIFPFRDVTDKIEGIAEAVMATLKKVKPQSASVEFGIEMAVESGQLTALLVKGTGTANLKITLQWGDSTLSNRIH
ncbi:MAG TPA: CU044_2847 family protein [Ktedonobacteraceae bacterium]